MATRAGADGVGVSQSQVDRFVIDLTSDNEEEQVLHEPNQNTETSLTTFSSRPEAPLPGSSFHRKPATASSPPDQKTWFQKIQAPLLSSVNDLALTSSKSTSPPVSPRLSSSSLQSPGRPRPYPPVTPRQSPGQEEPVSLRIHQLLSPGHRVPSEKLLATIDSRPTRKQVLSKSAGNSPTESGTKSKISSLVVGAGTPTELTRTIGTAASNQRCPERTENMMLRNPALSFHHKYLDADTKSYTSSQAVSQLVSPTTLASKTSQVSSPSLSQDEDAFDNTIPETISLDDTLFRTSPTRGSANLRAAEHCTVRRRSGIADNPAKRRRIDKAAERRLKRRVTDLNQIVKAPDRNLTKRLTHEEKTKIKEVMRRQMFPYIQAFLQPYSEVLDRDSRKHIAKQAQVILCDTRFRDHVRLHGKLTSVYEEVCSKRCRDIIMELAERAQTSNSVFRPSDNSPMLAFARDHAHDAPNPPTSASGSGPDSANDEEVPFGNEACRQNDPLPTTEIRGRYSSSPTTPYSDKNDSDTLVGVDVYHSSSRHRGCQGIACVASNKSDVYLPQGLTEPRTSYAIYRDDILPNVITKYSGLESQDSIFKIVRQMWRKESVIIRGYYRHEADEERRRFHFLHPKWTPLRASNIGTNTAITDFEPQPSRRGRPRGRVFIRPSQDRSLNGLQARLGSQHASINVPNYAAQLSQIPRKTDNARRFVLKRLEPDQNALLMKDRDRLQIAGLRSDACRPYLAKQSRMDIMRGLSIYRSNKKILPEAELMSAIGNIIHVDFEYRELAAVTRAIGLETTISPFSFRDLIPGLDYTIPQLVQLVVKSNSLPGRSRFDIESFLKDIVSGVVTRDQILRLQPSFHSDSLDSHAERNVNAALKTREHFRGHPSPGRPPVTVTLSSSVEDTLRRHAEWSDCPGDLLTFAWVSNDCFVCGAVTHSDSHNQQYNKPGNLLVGAVASGLLKSVPGHQIPRPIVCRGENSTRSMQVTQDPWLYCTVPSIAYDKMRNMCFTASYDKTVRVWDIPANRTSMRHRGTWGHDGNVNFVVVSPSTGRVATAADISEGAIRVYDINMKDISGSLYNLYTGGRASAQCLAQRQNQETWAYFPSTIQWGKAADVASLLLAGYSPRTLDVSQAEDIPDDKKNTGELCLWDTNTGVSIPVMSARMSNVFDVIWHPTQPIFLASTSVSGEHDEGVRTQIRLFCQKDLGSFINIKTLDCIAADINEITVMPNSPAHSYVTASCTDGNTYVWDTALGDKPVHILAHGASIDDQALQRGPEDVDVGVKFVAWGQHLDRLYTGSSDGVVKSWNIRAARGSEFVRDVASFSGGVSAGAFSPDHTKLVVGDATGKVHLLSVESGCEPGDKKETRVRKPIVPHREQLPPHIKEVAECDDQIGRTIAQGYLQRGEMVIHPDEDRGAVQGPNYSSTGLLRHTDANKPVWRPHLETPTRKSEFPELQTIVCRDDEHDRNLAAELLLEPQTQRDLVQERAEVQGTYVFDLEPVPNAIGSTLADMSESSDDIFLGMLDDGSPFEAFKADNVTDALEEIDVGTMAKQIQEELTIQRKLALVEKHNER